MKDFLFGINKHLAKTTIRRIKKPYYVRSYHHNGGVDGN